MGCCKSTEKKPNAQAKRDVKVDNVMVKVPTPKETKTEVKKIEETNQRAPTRLDSVMAARKSQYAYGKCAVDGETSSVLKGGLCYRIVKDGTCYLYNDTLQYEIHVHCQFPPNSSFSPASETTVKTTANNWTEVSAVVYPLETVEFGSGDVEVCKTEASAMPLSEEYFSRVEVLTDAAADEVERVKEHAKGSNDEESTLMKCVETRTPYVDLNFAPAAKMLSRPGVDCRVMPAMELRRPRECIPGATAVDAIRGDIVPQSVEPGFLGDTWLQSAIAILAEDKEKVKEMFAQTTEAEKRVGAYRVALNKNGWWQSVIVDDFLPSVNGVPAFARVVDDPTELWVSLLQKAYAKLHGSYASITGGDTLLALQDFSGATGYRFDKEWTDAAKDNVGTEKLHGDLAVCTERGWTVMLNTYATDEGGKYAKAGLKPGFAYYVEKVLHFPDAGLGMIKVHNPWQAEATWDGPWSVKCPNWKKYPDVAKACNPKAPNGDDGSFWMEWAEASTYFEGGGVLFTTQDKPVYDYRVQGDFHYVCPSVVLMVHATERVEVDLCLSQRDKRGVAVSEADSRFSPIMLTVSNGDGNKQCVHRNSTRDPMIPSEEFHFIVAREVGIRYVFEPRPEPYFVVPRIHRKGTAEGRQKEFVIGLRSATPLEGKLDVQFTKLDATSPVFKNRVSFVVESTTEVIRAFQKKAPGQAAVTETGSKLSEADYAPVVAEEPIAPAAEDEAKDEEANDDDTDVKTLGEENGESHDVAALKQQAMEENGTDSKKANGIVEDKDSDSHEL